MAFFGFLIFWAISFVVGVLLRAAVKRPQAKAGEIEVPQTEEGTPIPAIFGTVKLGPETLWFGDVLEEPIKGPTRQFILAGPKDTIGYRYHVGMQGGLCWGPVDALVDIIVAEKYSLSTFGSRTERTYNEGTGLYDDTTIQVIAPPLPQNTQSGGLLFTVNDPDMFGGKEREGGIVGPLRFYWGTSGQGANSYLQTETGISPFPAYKGLCYAVWEQVYMGTSPYIKPWQFILRRCPNTLGTLAGDVTLSRIGDDANPAEVLYELWTDSRWGLGRSSGDLDTDSFLDALQTLSDEGLGISGTMLGSEKAEEKVKEILGTIDAVLVSDPLTGLLRLKLIRADYTVSDLETFTPSNSRDLTYSRPEPDELTAEVKVRFTDASQNFTTRVRPAYNPALRQITTRSTPMVVDYPLITTGANADRLALRDLKAVSTTLASGSLVVTRGASHLAPGDPFVIDDPDQGITSLVARVTRVNYGTPHGEDWVELQWTEDVFGVTDGVFTTDPTDTWTPPGNPEAGARFEVSTTFTLSDTQGCLTLRITGDISSITLVETRTQKGGEPAGDWTTQSNSAPITVCVDRDDIEIGHIAYRITYTASDGSTDTIEDEFDVPPLGADDGNAQGTPGNFVLTMRTTPPLVLAGAEVGTDTLLEPPEARADRIWVSLKKVNLLGVQGGSGRAGGTGVVGGLIYSLTGANGSFVALGPEWPLSVVAYPAVGTPVAIDAAAKAADIVCLSWGTKGGDGETTVVEVGNIYVPSVSATTTPEAPEPPDTDVPNGGDFGNIIDDRNAKTLGLADTDPVTGWVDDSSSSQPTAVPNAAAGQAAPTFRATGFPGGDPCVEFDGVDDGLRIASQITGSSYTTYWVLAALGTPGGVGIAALWDAPNGYPRGKGVTVLGPSIVGGTGGMGAYVNTHVYFPTFENVEDTWDRSLAHLYCKVFDEATGFWELYIDDMTTPVASNSCPPQFTESSVTWLMFEPGLAPVSGKWGREVTWDRAHAVTQRSAVRTALKALWSGLP